MCEIFFFYFFSHTGSFTEIKKKSFPSEKEKSMHIRQKQAPLTCQFEKINTLVSRFRHPRDTASGWMLSGSIKPDLNLFKIVSERRLSGGSN